MLNKNIRKHFILLFLLIIPVLISLQDTISAEHPPNPSNGNSNSIFITSNAKLDAFVAGNGTTGLTIESAHRIENITIQTNPEEYGIFIQNVDRFLIIRNCSIYSINSADSKESGIEIRLSKNIIIDNCSISDHNIGIMLLDSHQVLINRSILSQNFEAGIKLLESDNNILTYNTITNNLGYGIYLKRAHENTVMNNFLENNGNICIFNRGNDNIFENNSCEPTSNTAILGKTWLWVVIGVGSAVFFIGGLMFFITWRGHV